MESQFDDELLQLKNALCQETFRFILVGHNRFSIYQDISSWLRTIFPERHFLELRLANKDYRHINDELVAFHKGIVLIPNFGWLFRKENEAICVAFNQRRDAFARLDIALVCFIEPNEFIEVPRKVPDWWSLRSLELDFHRETSDVTGEFLSSESEISSLGGQTKEEKEAEIQRLLRQIEAAESTNKSLLAALYYQIATLYFDTSLPKEAQKYYEQSLAIRRQLGDKAGESTILNNIGRIYLNRYEYDKALEYYEQSLAIRRQLGDKAGEGSNLSYIGLIYLNQDEYDKALEYYERSLAIRRQLGNKAGEGSNLNNIGVIYRIQGDGIKALEYYEQSLAIRRQLGDKAGENTTLNNIGQIYLDRGEYNKALEYLEQSLSIAHQIGNKYNTAMSMNNLGILYFSGLHNIEKSVPLLLRSYAIFQSIGSPSIQSPKSFLNTILEEIGEERFNKIAQDTQDDPQL